MEVFYSSQKRTLMMVKKSWLDGVLNKLLPQSGICEQLFLGLFVLADLILDMFLYVWGKLDKFLEIILESSKVALKTWHLAW